ncbi:polysaccharide biosynthesis protein, partial [Pseudomonas aeruginosa]
EVLPYLALLYFLVLHSSIVGAAIAWTVRVSVDFLLLEYFSRK